MASSGRVVADSSIASFLAVLLNDALELRGLVNVECGRDASSPVSLFHFILYSPAHPQGPRILVVDSPGEGLAPSLEAFWQLS